MKFDFEKFVKDIHNRFIDKIDELSVKELLRIDEDGYYRDSPESMGKRLKISNIQFTGEKENGEKIDYSRELKDGVNLWIADNLKGKSSIFKIVKLALTGDLENLPKDIKAWVRYIFVEFYILEKVYTAYFDLTNPRMKGILYKIPITELKSISENSENKENYIAFEANSESQYTSDIQTLFFKNFDYYSLKWTGKDPNKENIGLRESNSSWKTYFKSIYLESKDRSNLYIGNQNELIFQMLLGLDFTYPINRLKVKSEKLQSELGVKRSYNESNKKEANAPAIDINQKKQELDKVIKYLAELKNKNQSLEQLRKLNDDYNKLIQKQINQANTRKGIFEKIEVLEKNKSKLCEDLKKNEGEVEKYNKEIEKLTKRGIELREHIDSFYFLSNLEVKVCPHCNHGIEKTRFEYEKSEHKCMLCDHDILEKPVDKEHFELKITELKTSIQQLKKDEYNYRLKSSNNDNDIKKIQDEISGFYEGLRQMKQENIDNQLKEIENQIDRIKTEQDSYESRYEKLVEEKVKLENELKPKEELPKDNATENEIEKLNLHISIIETAKSILEALRLDSSQRIVQNLETLILNQLIQFGIKNYTSVSIQENFKIAFTKNNREFQFDEISEGEKLRVKLALYISIIEMDIEYRYGRHPRFIIIDTPLNEEGDHTYLDGFINTLKFIEDKFKDNLQIFVGSRHRELIDSVTPDKVEVKEEDIYLF